MPTFLVPITLFGWLPAVILLFAALPPRRAFITAYVAAWLFLPMASYPIPGLPDYAKMTATGLGILLATMIFQFDRLARFRPGWHDLPMLVWCLVPVPTYVANGLGLYDALSAVMFQVFIWGIHWFLARIYFDDLDGLKMLCVALAVGGLLYVPLCLYEIRMSPQLHRIFYGFHQHSFVQSKREDGSFRPTVFMQHGLAVATFMTCATLAAFWMWLRGTVRVMAGVPTWLIAAGLGATTVACKSELATILLFAGAGVLLLLRTGVGRTAVLALVLVSPAYMVVRGSGMWDGMSLIETAASTSGTARAKSLATRIYSENRLTRKAMERPLLGWGGFGRYLEVEDGAKVIPDGMWVVALGKYGLVGLVSFTLTVLMPPVLVMRRFSLATWRAPGFAPVVVLALLLALHMIDNLMNAMVNPLYVIFGAALVGFATSAARSASQPGGRQPPRRGVVAGAAGPGGPPPRGRGYSVVAGPARPAGPRPVPTGPGPVRPARPARPALPDVRRPPGARGRPPPPRALPPPPSPPPPPTG